MGSPSSGSTGDSVGSPKLIPQPHGGALSRGGRKPGAKNKPKPLLARVKAAAGRKCIFAVRVVADIMQDPDADPAVRLRAAGMLLDRGIGRPVPVDDPGEGREKAFRVTAEILGIEVPE